MEATASKTREHALSHVKVRLELELTPLSFTSRRRCHEELWKLSEDLGCKVAEPGRRQACTHRGSSPIADGGLQVELLPGCGRQFSPRSSAWAVQRAALVSFRDLWHARIGAGSVERLFEASAFSGEVGTAGPSLHVAYTMGI